MTPLGYFSFLVEIEMFHIREEVPGKSGAIFLSGVCFCWTKINSGGEVGHQIAWWLVFMVVYDRAGIGGGSPVKVHLWPCRLVGCIVVGDYA